MIYSGLLSVTFRQLKPVDIIKLVSEADLQAIEWGGDIHVPHGDLQAAAKIRQMTLDEGIQIASYGSYYKAGVTESTDFRKVLETALALGAPAIRVWAGNKGSEASDEMWRGQVAEELRRIAELAGAAGLTIDLEYHNGTLTDTAESSVRLLKASNHPSIRCNWQPPTKESPEQKLQGLRQILPWLANIHVYHWLTEVRCPLEEGISEWKRYFQTIKETCRPRYMMLEFVRDDSPDQFLKDAEVLKRIIE